MGPPVRSTKVTAMLAQWAQIHPSGTVNIMGGGLTVIPHEVPVIFIAGNIQVGWDAIGVTHSMRLELLDDPGATPSETPRSDGASDPDRPS